MTEQAPILIVGAGLAGLFLALKLAPHPVMVISPAPLGEAASSAWAQGGMAAALDPEDSPSQHAADTVAAGAGLTDPIIAQLIAQEGPARILDLIKLGVPFDRTPEGALSLSLEAAHSRPRVARVAGDLAGRAIMDALSAAIHASEHVTLIQPARAISLLQTANGEISGALIETGDRKTQAVQAKHTILCAGGIGGLFRVTTNPAGARGDALSMAYQCGALLSDLEFVQFHPTAMDFGLDPSPLATEALRGEGAKLRSADGTAFMLRYDPDGELAARDIVARAIAQENAAGRATYLDAREAVGAEFPEHFPTVFSACRSAGVDPRVEMIPVIPAVHYHMGGVVCDIWGQTSLEGLSVCGECASTGAHGANRLASNSLLEAVVFAERIARRLQATSFKAFDVGHAVPPPALPDPVLQNVRANMSAQCGVARNGTDLAKLVASLDEKLDRYGKAHALVAARGIASSALAREESRGGHFRTDFPDEFSPARQFVSRDI